MKRRAVFLAVSLSVVLLMAGCAQRPTYSEVRQETLDALQQVVDLLPEPGRIERTPEFEPYGCDDKLLLHSRGGGAFYTGQWKVAVPDSFDVEAFLQQLPDLLGAGWTREELGVPTQRAFVYLVRDSPRMTLSAEQSTLDEGKAVELLAISRCGVEDTSSESPPR